MRYVPLFLPFLLAYLLQDTPAASYWVAWAGSFFILGMTLSGKVKRLPEGRPLIFQLFRPIVFTQLIFAGYTCLTSVFYFLSISRQTGLPGWVPATLPLVAQAQSYYVLMHAAVATGMLVFMNYGDSGHYRVVARLGANRLLLGISASFFLLYLVTKFFPGFFQVSYRLRDIAIVASVFSFALSLIHREGTHIWLNAAVFAANFGSALLGGWKEEVLVLLMLFFAALFPYYRKATAIVATVVFALFVVIMPAFTSVYRTMTWYGGIAPKVAARLAFDELTSGRMDVSAMAEEFARGRLSEIGLFTIYVQQVPANRPFYGSQIISQAAMNLVPRLVWATKPDTERLVMERVFENQVYSRLSRISAKPQFVVDAYLSFGVVGIVVGGLVYGMLAAFLSRVAERWFGGYTLGSGLVFASLFKIFWRGNAFEFFFGTVFWSVMMMAVLFQLGTRFKLIVPTRSPARPPAPLPPAKSAAPRWAELAHREGALRDSNGPTHS